MADRDTALRNSYSYNRILDSIPDSGFSSSASIRHSRYASCKRLKKDRQKPNKDEPRDNEYLCSKTLPLSMLGIKYLLPASIFRRYPETLLGKLATASHEEIIEYRLADAYLPQSHEYFFMRTSSSFELILPLYIKGELHKPSHVCREQFEAHLDYWEIPKTEDFLCIKCCRDILRCDSDSSRSLSPPLSLQSEPAIEDWSYGGIRQRVWTWVDQTTTRIGCVFTVITLSVLLLNFILMVLDSMPELRYSDDCAIYFGVVKGQNYTVYEATGRESKYIDLCAVNMFITIWFSLEFLLRVWACPSRLDFVRDIKNWFDLLSTMPLFVELILKSTTDDTFKTAVFRLPKFFRLIKHVEVMAAGMVASKDSFVLLVLLAGFFVFGLSTTLYYVEGDEPESPFSTIPGAAWWSISTYFAYGDCVPVTSMGKVVSSVGAICGIVVLAFPIGLILDSFTATFKRYQGDGEEDAEPITDVKM